MLQYVQINVSGGVNWATLFIIILYISYSIFQGSYRFSSLISYPLGFIMGAISDLSALWRLYGSSIYVIGGVGIVDGDFLLPIFLFLTVKISILIIKKLKKINGIIEELK
jgi:hypothetical protein